LDRTRHAAADCTERDEDRADDEIVAAETKATRAASAIFGWP